MVLADMKYTGLVAWIKGVRWKNEPAGPKEAYIPTTLEHCANVVTHGVWIVPSVLGVYHLLVRCKTSTQLLAASLYGTSLLLLFLVSTCFHTVFFCCKQGQAKEVLHRCDRAIIYIFIAGSYYPWTMLLEYTDGSLGCNASWLIWVLACCGITYQQLYHERYKLLETVFYCCIGIIPAFVLMSQCKGEFVGYGQMRYGGLLYLVGVFFFKADGRVPFAHAIWHLFVAAAAFVHYVTISYYLFPDPDPALGAAIGYIRRIEL